MTDLAAIAALTLLTLLIARWRYLLAAARSGDGLPDVPGDGTVKRQAGYFAIATAGVVFLAGALASLFIRPALGAYVDASLKSRLQLSLAGQDGALDVHTLELMLDKISNRVAFPELYQDYPADLALSNAVQWQSRMLDFADTATLLAIALAAALSLAWRLSQARGHLLAPQLFYELMARRVLLAVSSVAVLCSVGIVATLVVESALFFSEISIFDFIFGTQWNPQMAIRADQTAAQGAFGFVPLISGTVLISAIAIGIAFPVGLAIAIYTSEYARGWQRNLVKPTLEILTGIPTVVYGAFAAIFAGPWLKEAFGALGLEATVESALAVGVIMGIMIIPLVSSLIDDALRQVPNSIREAMLAIGATRFELVTMVLLPATMPGIVSALILAVSRAFGETMIVVMAAGLSAKLTINPLEAVTTVTVQIATILVGDQAFDSIKTLSAFALGLALFVITLSLNMLALWVSHRYRVVYQ